MSLVDTKLTAGLLDQPSGSDPYRRAMDAWALKTAGLIASYALAGCEIGPTEYSTRCDRARGVAIYDCIVPVYTPKEVHHV